MRPKPTAKDLAWTTVVALGGIVLYVPAAIGLGIAELLHKPAPKDAGWRFPASHIVEPEGLAITNIRPADLWSHMNLRQYFTLVPGATAVARGFCAFSRPLPLIA